MNIKCDKYNHVCVVAITGELAAEGVAAFRKAVEEQTEQQQIVNFVIDLEKCPFIDSEGLETLLWLKRRCEDRFGQVKLANLDENCRKIVEVTRLAHRFECAADLLAAVKNMR